MIPPIASEALPAPAGATTVNNLLACLVCGSMIDVTNLKEQHVVKCANCNEATVSLTIFSYTLLSTNIFHGTAFATSTTGTTFCSMSLQLFARLQCECQSHLMPKGSMVGIPWFVDYV